MKKVTRIGLIRDAIVSAGGSSGLVYYADGPNGFNRKSDRKCVDGEVRYKVANYSDGLSCETRRTVAETLNSNPLVERAYISRIGKYGYMGRLTGQAGGHLIVLFEDKAK